MAFCKNIGRTLYKAMHDVDEVVLSVADQVISVTGRIKSLQSNPTIQMIEKALGVGAPVMAWIDKALDAVYKIEVIGKTLAEKLKDFLEAQPTELSKNAALAKIASVATSYGDKRELKEHVYDQAVTIAIAREKTGDSLK